MPLVMLGADYSRHHMVFGAETDPGFVGPPSSLKPGTIDWNNALQNAVTGGMDVLKTFLLTSKKVSSTPEEKAIVDSAAKAHGITLADAAPWMIGRGAVLLVAVLLMMKKRRR